MSWPIHWREEVYYVLFCSLVNLIYLLSKYSSVAVFSLFCNNKFVVVIMGLFPTIFFTESQSLFLTHVFYISEINTKAEKAKKMRKYYLRAIRETVSVPLTLFS